MIICKSHFASIIIFINANLLFFTIVGDPVLTAIPAESILNEAVTLKCQFESAVPGAVFTIPVGRHCSLESCKKPPCSNNFSCSENKTFEITMNVNASWNNQTFSCEKAFGGNKSNFITMRVKGEIIIMGVRNVFIHLFEKYKKTRR